MGVKRIVELRPVYGMYMGCIWNVFCRWKEDNKVMDPVPTHYPNRHVVHSVVPWKPLIGQCRKKEQ